MKKVKIKIEMNSEGYWAHSTNVPSLYGAGDCLAACKANLLNGIDSAKLLKGKNKFNYADFKLMYRFEIKDILHCYRSIVLSKYFLRNSGISKKQMKRFMSGKDKMSKENCYHVQEAFQKVAKDLGALKL